MNKDERIQLRIDKDLKRRALKYAKRQGMPLSQIVAQHLRTLVEEDKPKVRDDDGVRQI